MSHSPATPSPHHPDTGMLQYQISCLLLLDTSTPCDHSFFTSNFFLLNHITLLYLFVYIHKQIIPTQHSIDRSPCLRGGKEGIVVPDVPTDK